MKKQISRVGLVLMVLSIAFLYLAAELLKNRRIILPSVKPK